VPVFWLATEDHDFEEVNHVWTCGPEHEPVRLAVEGKANGRPRPVGGVAVEEYPTAALRETLREFAYGDEVAALVEEAYRPGRTMGEAFACLLKKLLPHAGLILMDPMQPEIRALAAPFLREAVHAAPELIRDVVERNKTLENSGYHAQVHVEDKTSLFFLLENGERQVLRREGGQYAAGSRKFTAEDLQGRAAELSPNALLRPVMQDYLLPTLAYVGGPAELAYLAQSEVIYRKLLGRFPLVMPRAGFTLLDARGAKLMERYGLHLTDFFDSGAALREKIARKLVPPRLMERFVETRAELTGAMAGLDGELMALDRTLEAAFQKSRAKMFYQLGKIESKVARETLRRDERAKGDAAYLEGLIYPNQHLQERFYTILPFLAQHGLDLVDRLHHQICLDCPDHLIVTV
jgi:bacillithiol synthase